MDNWIREITKDAIVFNKDHVRINIHILFEKDNDIYNAHCLEFDLVGEGSSIEDAEKSIVNNIVNYVTFAISKGLFNKIINPAPPEYWNKLQESEDA